MEPPTLPLKPEDIEGTIDGVDEIKRLAVSFVMLVNYVKEQRAQCGKKPGVEPGTTTDGS